MFKYKIARLCVAEVCLCGCTLCGCNARICTNFCTLCMQSSEVLPCTLLDTNWAAFRLPTLEELLQSRIVICTCLAASFMLLRYDTEVGCSPLVFTHALIDEAGQSPYPEALIPLLLLPSDGGSCLAGVGSLVVSVVSVSLRLSTWSRVARCYHPPPFNRSGGSEAKVFF